MAAGPGTGRHGSRPTLWWLQAPPPPPVPSSGPPRRHRGLRCPHLSTKNHGLKQYLKETGLTLHWSKESMCYFPLKFCYKLKTRKNIEIFQLFEWSRLRSLSSCNWISNVLNISKLPIILCKQLGFLTPTYFKS